MNAQVIALVKVKRAVWENLHCANLGVGLAQAGKKVLLVDVNPRSALSSALVILSRTPCPSPSRT